MIESGIDRREQGGYWVWVERDRTELNTPLWWEPPSIGRRVAIVGRWKHRVTKMCLTLVGARIARRRLHRKAEREQTRAISQELLLGKKGVA